MWEFNDVYKVDDEIELMMWVKKASKKQTLFRSKKEPRNRRFRRRSRSSKTSNEVAKWSSIFVDDKMRALRVEVQWQLSWESRSDTSSVPQGFERFLSRVRSTISEIARSARVGKDEHRRCEDRNECSDVRIAASGWKKFSIGNFCNVCTS